MVIDRLNDRSKLITILILIGRKHIEDSLNILASTAFRRGINVRIYTIAVLMEKYSLTFHFICLNFVSGTEESRNAIVLIQVECSVRLCEWEASYGSGKEVLCDSVHTQADSHNRNDFSE